MEQHRNWIRVITFKKDDTYMIIVLDFFIVKRVSVPISNTRYWYAYRYKIHICRIFRAKCVCMGNEVMPLPNKKIFLYNEMKSETGSSFCFLLHLPYLKQGRRGVYPHCDHSRLTAYPVHEIKLFCNPSKVCGWRGQHNRNCSSFTKKKCKIIYHQDWLRHFKLTNILWFCFQNLSPSTFIPF